MHGHGQSPAGPHGRALVDLSGESFAWLRATVSEAADRVFALEQSLKVHVSNASIPRGKLREAVRQQLETTDAIQQDITVPNWWSPTTDTDLDQIAPEMRHGLQTAEGQDLLLGFSRGIVRAHARRPAPAPVLLQDADHWVRWKRAPARLNTWYRLGAPCRRHGIECAATRNAPRHDRSPSEHTAGPTR
jgi:hypothetical protein